MLSTYEQKISIPRRLQEIHQKNSVAVSEIDLSLLQRPDISLEQGDICCDTPNIREEKGFFVCLNCGMVHDVIIDSTPRRAFTAEEVRNRKGTEPVYSKIGPRTVIRGSRDAKGTQLNAEQKLKFSRLAKIHRSLTTSYERNLYIALPSLDRFQEQLGLPDIVTEDALRIYTRAVREKLTLGRTNDAILGASILSAVRVHDIPRSMKEILDTTGLNRRKTIRAYHLISQRILPKLNMKVQHFNSVRYVDKFFEELGSSMTIRNAAIDLLKKCIKKGLPIAGKDPRGLAGAVIYLAGMKSAEKKTQHEIATTLRITEVTLRNRIKEITRCNRTF
ncbi:MAG: transcription initiation factor IIB [Promethearchaeota archaeon CR_4]|nr:MAG: transcription initiation factor IIB [Candidatus Lokiarchaeota archaeon CR_4]